MLYLLICEGGPRCEEGLFPTLLLFKYEFIELPTASLPSVDRGEAAVVTLRETKLRLQGTAQHTDTGGFAGF